MKQPRCLCPSGPCPRWAVEESSYGVGSGEAQSRAWPARTPGKKVYFTLTFMMRIATPRTMKNPQGFVGAGFKPALGVSGTHQERFRRRAGLKPAPTQPRFVLTSVVFFTLKISPQRSQRNPLLAITFRITRQVRGRQPFSQGQTPRRSWRAGPRAGGRLRRRLRAVARTGGRACRCARLRRRSARRWP